MNNRIGTRRKKKVGTDRDTEIFGHAHTNNGCEIENGILNGVASHFNLVTYGMSSFPLVKSSINRTIALTTINRIMIMIIIVLTACQMTEFA